MKLTRNQLRQLIMEDLAGFMQDVSVLEKDKRMVFADVGSWEVQSEDDQKLLKRLFAKHADRQFLNTLDTVHWVNDIEQLRFLSGKNRDELSCTMTLPTTGNLRLYRRHTPFGLWIDGWITYATNDEDYLYSKYKHHYFPRIGASEKTVGAFKHKKRSSGINKRPTVYPSLWAPIDNLGSSIILDASTFDPIPGRPNEALVDNWRAKGIVCNQSAVNYKKAIPMAELWNIPIYSLTRELLWKPNMSFIERSKASLRDLF